MSGVLETPVVVASFKKNAGEEVRVSLGSFKGNNTIDARVWAASADGKVIATRSGITMGVRHLRALSDGLAAALTEAERRGLLPCD